MTCIQISNGILCVQPPFKRGDPEPKGYLARQAWAEAQQMTPKERPILFQGPMVRALLDGSKTQTRRVIKDQSIGERFSHMTDDGRAHLEWLGTPSCGSGVWDVPEHSAQIASPYGQPGDRLWVRESGWERPERTQRMLREGADTWAPYYYDADHLSEQDHADFKAWGFKRRASIHMPRWASRITLEVNDVRVERLQDISESDAIAEGITYSDRFRGYCIGKAEHFHSHDPRESYRGLWTAINGPASWDANPWVWVIGFSKLEPRELI